jgi:hypothetical protein
VVFLTLGIGALVTALALWVELHLRARHADPRPALGAAHRRRLPGSLRIGKGWLLALEYRNARGEGRMADDCSMTAAHSR